MVCERCGYEITENYRRSICPACGTQLREGTEAQSLSDAVPYTRTRASSHATHPPEFTTSEPQTEPYEGVPLYSSKTFYQQGTFYTPGTSIFWLRSYNSALLVEFVLSLVGIFGIGWLLAGEMVIGFALLACSILLYWPVMVLGTLFTLGFGLICLGPFAIGAIICNAFLLNRYLKRKAKRMW